MLFTDELYNSTKDAHTIVDRHQFVSMIRKDKRAGDLYINFNKVCIYELEKCYNISKIDKNLIRGIDISNLKIVDSDSLEQLRRRCKEYPLEHIYMFYLGLLFGGNMLSKMLPEHRDFLKFDNPQERINTVKTFLNENINDKDDFIKNVNKSYDLIKNIFDDYYNFIKNE